MAAYLAPLIPSNSRCFHRETHSVWKLLALQHSAWMFQESRHCGQTQRAALMYLFMLVVRRMFWLKYSSSCNASICGMLLITPENYSDSSLSLWKPMYCNPLTMEIWWFKSRNVKACVLVGHLQKLYTEKIRFTKKSYFESGGIFQVDHLLVIHVVILFSFSAVKICHSLISFH